VKRRDFLLTSAAGIVGSKFATPASAAAPCPPSPVSAAGQAGVTTQCVASSPGTAPAWFVSLPERVWTDVAGGSAYSGSAFQKGARLSDVAPSPYTYGNSQDSIIVPWTGGCSLQNRGEYIKACEGGHTDGSDNGVYALLLKTATPYWSRIWGPNVNSGGNNLDTAGVYNVPFVAHGNGAPCTAHGWYSRVCSEGAGGTNERIWLLMTNEGESGCWTTDAWSIPRAALGAGVTDPALWMYHGRQWPSVPGGAPGSSFGYQNGPHAFDSVANQIMSGADFAINNGIVRIDVATCVAAGKQAASGGAVPGSTQYDIGDNTAWENAWSVVTTNTNPRCWIVGSTDNNLLYVFNLQSPTSGARTKSVTGGNISGTAGLGAVYHDGVNKIVVGGAAGTQGSLTSNIYTIAIPSDPWNATSGFTMSTIAPAGGSLSQVASFQGSYGAFQMIRDMGNGQACLVLHCRDVTLPTYVYKLPVAF